MVRSSGFGSTLCNLFRPIQTRFRFGSVTKSLNLATYRNSPAHSTKGTRSNYHLMMSRPLSACKHTVSGSLSLPSRGSFHRSLTVLFAIGHLVPPKESSISVTGLLPCFVQLSRCFHLSSFLFYGGPKPQRYFYPWFGLMQFRSPLLPQSFFYFLFLRLLRCFSSAGSLHYTI